MRKRAGVFIISLCLLVLIFAVFSHEGNAEIIYGCVAKNGTLTIVSGPDQCGGKGTLISWTSVEGMSAAVHGVVLYDGTVADGVGFTSKFQSNVYYITFEQAFSGNPHCVVTPNTSPPTVLCAILGYGPSILDVNCMDYTTSQYVQITFSFICML